MGMVWRSIAAAAVAVVFLFVVGYFQVRAEALQLGLMLQWDLQPAQVTQPAVGMVEYTAIFVIFGVVAALFLMSRRGLFGKSGIPALVGGLTLVAVSVWYITTVDHAVPVADLNQVMESFGLTTAFETGGLSSTTHGMAALLIVIALIRSLQPTRVDRPDGAARPLRGS